MLASHLTGWFPNAMMLFRAEGESLDNPSWTHLGNPTKSNTSFNSQPAFVLPVQDPRGDTVFM